MSQYYQDLIRIGSYTIRQINRPYNIIDRWETSIEYVYNLFKVTMNSSNRIMTMVYAYYLGELIQSSVTPKEK
jgi:hypothetical protein